MSPSHRKIEAAIHKVLNPHLYDPMSDGFRQECFRTAPLSEMCHEDWDPIEDFFLGEYMKDESFIDFMLNTLSDTGHLSSLTQKERYENFESDSGFNRSGHPRSSN